MQNNNCSNCQMMNNMSTSNTKIDLQNSEFEKYYPEIYKVVYPMIRTKCKKVKDNITKDDIENITDEIYNAIEINETTNININMTNQVTTTKMQTRVTRKSEVNIPPPKRETNEENKTRQINNGLRDLIKILLIRELINRPVIPGGRPPISPRPPIRPPFNPSPGRPPFNRDELNPDFDLYEY